MIKNTLIFALFVLTYSTATTQFLIENNNSQDKAKLKVKTETGYYNMLDGSICLMWIKEFNQQGLLTEYKDHWQCGQLYWTYAYEYDNSGKCIKSFKSSYKENFKRIEMRHKFNSKSQMIEREAVDSSGYPTVEHYSYDISGNITKLTFSGPKKNGEKHPWSKSWNGDKTYKILAKEEIRDVDNKLKWTVIRKYDLYE